MSNEIPSKPTKAPKAQLADKNKAMTTGAVVKKDTDPNIGHTPLKK